MEDLLLTGPHPVVFDSIYINIAPAPLFPLLWPFAASDHRKGCQAINWGNWTIILQHNLWGQQILKKIHVQRSIEPIELGLSSMSYLVNKAPV